MESAAAKLIEAIRGGTMAALPAGEITGEALTRRNASGNTPLHLAAKHGRLRDLPPGMLTRDHLTLRNDAGYTPLHHAALGGHLDQVRSRC